MSQGVDPSRHSVVVMGVSGAGKSAVGTQIAAGLGYRFVDADDLHSDLSRDRMRRGTPLDDHDRGPWLREVIESLDEGRIVVTCSALRRAHRDLLRESAADLGFVYLAGEPALLEARMRARREHFMPVGLLDSQLQTLEDPTDEPDVIRFDVEQPIDRISMRAIAALQLKSRTTASQGIATTRGVHW